jgi:hypothetical protein
MRSSLSSAETVSSVLASESKLREQEFEQVECGGALVR